MNPGSLRDLLAMSALAVPAPKILECAIEPRDDYVLERLALDFGDGEPVRGLLTRPAAGTALPAVLYCHAHGAKYDIGASELLDGRPSLIDAYGPLLARRGFVTLSIDMPTFGTRQIPGEDALSKALLWQGYTLMGKMLSDLLAAFQHLASRDDVDATRIAAFGLSMGPRTPIFSARCNRVSTVWRICVVMPTGKRWWTPARMTSTATI